MQRPAHSGRTIVRKASKAVSAKGRRRKRVTKARAPEHGEQGLGEQGLGEQGLGEQGLGEQGLDDMGSTITLPAVMDLAAADSLLITLREALAAQRPCRLDASKVEKLMLPGLQVNEGFAVMANWDELKQTFFEETNEGLEAIDAGLTDMRHGAETEDTVNAVFRAIHSVKGGAGVFGFEALVNFAHVFETVLDAIRHGTLSPGPDILDTLFSASYVLADLVGMARNGQEAPPAYGEECRAALELLIEQEAGGGEADGGTTASPDLRSRRCVPTSSTLAMLARTSAVSRSAFDPPPRCCRFTIRCSCCRSCALWARSSSLRTAMRCRRSPICRPPSAISAGAERCARPGRGRMSNGFLHSWRTNARSISSSSMRPRARPPRSQPMFRRSRR